MRILLFFIFIIVLTTGIYAQSDQKELIEEKLVHYQEMQKKGRNFMIIGGLTTIGGIVMASTAEWNCSYGSCDSDDPKAIFGTLCALTGIALGTTGIIYNSIGNKKVRQYNRILDNLTIGITPGAEVLKFQLVYKF